jgi:hypothetical protein
MTESILAALASRKTVRARALVVFPMILLAAAGCSLLSDFGYQTEKANKLVLAANAALEDSRDRLSKNNPSLNEIDQASQAKTMSDFERLRSLAKETLPDIEKATQGYTDAAGKLDEASKLKLRDKYKEYLEVRGQAVRKGGELIETMAGMLAALVESNSPDDYQNRAAKLAQRIYELKKESEDLTAKANDIHEQNKEVFVK